jgi:hypothetical protein
MIQQGFAWIGISVRRAIPGSFLGDQILEISQIGIGSKGSLLGYCLQGAGERWRTKPMNTGTSIMVMRFVRGSLGEQNHARFQNGASKKLSALGVMSFSEKQYDRVQAQIRPLPKESWMQYDSRVKREARRPGET